MTQEYMIALANVQSSALMQTLQCLHMKEGYDTLVTDLVARLGILQNELSKIETENYRKGN